MHVDVVGAPEEADEDELGRGMGVDRACSARGNVGRQSALREMDCEGLHEKVHHAEGEANLCPDWRKGEESRRSDGAANVYVHDHTENRVECRRE